MLFLEKTKRIIIPEGVYFVTVNTKDQYPYFREEILCELWIEELRLCKELKKFELFAFCLNYDHFHMLLRPGKEVDISKVMQCLKRNFSRDANKIISGDILVTAIPQSRLGANMDSRLQEGGQTFGRLQKEHQGFVQKLKDKFSHKYDHSSSFPRFFWQQSFYDHVIRDERDLEEHYKYTAYNFDKHELPKDWKYTSLNFTDLLDEL